MQNHLQNSNVLNIEHNLHYQTAINKQFDLNTFSKQRDLLKQNQQTLVFTNGVFDLVHYGHLTALMAAKALGDYLVVAINSDASVKRLKGKSRPINTEKERAFLLASLSFIDAVLVFEEDTPINHLINIKPEFYVKSGDYSLDSLPETPYMHSWQGQVCIVPFIAGFSSTNIIQKIELQAKN